MGVSMAMGVPPNQHPLLDGIFPFLSQPFGGTPISGNPPYSAIFTCHFGEVWDLHRCPYVPSLATRVFEVEETPDEKLQAMQRLEVDRELLRGISLRTSYHVAGGIFHSCWCFMMVADSFSDGWWMLMVFSDSYQKCFVGGIASIASHLAKFFEWSQRKTILERNMANNMVNADAKQANAGNGTCDARRKSLRGGGGLWLRSPLDLSEAARPDESRWGFPAPRLNTGRSYMIIHDNTIA